MTVTLQNPEAIAEIEQLMARFDLSAEGVLEAVILEAGAWMPMEILSYSAKNPVGCNADGSRIASEP